MTTTNPDTIILTWKKTDSNKVMVVILLIYLYNVKIPGSKGLSPRELAHKWVKDLRTSPDMRILGRIVGVRSTKQSVGIKVGGF